MSSPDAPARPNRTTFRIDYTPELLAALRQAYEETPQSIEAIATPHGISRRTLAMKAEREGWVRFQRPALDLSPAAKLDARLAEAESELAQSEPAFPLPPRALASGGEGSGVGGSLSNREATPTRPAAQADLPLAGGGKEEGTGGGEKQASPPENWNLPESPRQPESLASRFQRVAEAALGEAEALIAALKVARQQMEETGRYAQAAQRGRELAELTNSLYRIKRLHAGAPDGARTDDANLTDLDARRDALARRIEIIVAEWRDAESAGQAAGE